MDSGGPKEPCIRWGPDSPCGGAILRGKGQLIVKYRDSAVSCIKVAEPTEKLLGMWIRLGKI